jgi:hypothetical protein
MKTESKLQTIPYEVRITTAERTRIIIPIIAEKRSDEGISVQDPVLQRMLDGEETESKVFQMSIFLDQIEIFHEVMFESDGPKYTMIVLDIPGYTIITPLDFEEFNSLYEKALLFEYEAEEKGKIKKK